MKLLLFVFIFFTFTACTSNLSKDEMLVNKMTAKYHELMRENEQMIVQGSGGGMMHGLSLLNYIYACPKLVDLEEARRINLRCIEKFFIMINNNQEIRPCLAEYPFPINGLNLLIAFYPYDPQNPQVEDCYIYKTFFVNGKIAYMKYDIEKKTEDFIFTETYEEALQRADLCAETD